MTTQEWIAKNYNTTNGYEKRFASVMRDSHGTIYSYGYHYPLMLKMGKFNIVNVSNYSATTRRHQLWAKQSVDDYIPVRLPRGFNIYNATFSDYAQLLQDELDGVRSRMKHKVRKNTKVYEMLELDEAKLIYRIKLLTGVAV
jgi:hypothetical protein